MVKREESAGSRASGSIRPDIATILMKTNSLFRSRPLATITAAAALSLGAVSSQAATFTGGMLTLNDATSTGSGPANPYPSTVNVSGLQDIAATGSHVTLTINNFSRPSGRAGDIDMLLVGPTGASLIFWSDVGTNAATAVNVSITLSDSASAYLPASAALTSGTFKPTNEGTPQDAFPAPAPTGTHGDPGGAVRGAGPDTFGTEFDGTNPNGTWSLYIVDDTLSNDTVGSVSSWSLNIDAPAVPEPSTWAGGALLLGTTILTLRRRRSAVLPA